MLKPSLILAGRWRRSATLRPRRYTTEGQHGEARLDEEERRALGQRVRMAAELRLGAAELRELNRIGVNLNQMARALNSRAVSSPAETQEVVERVGELVAKLLAGERE